jgi:hypothetical protein
VETIVRAHSVSQDTSCEEGIVYVAKVAFHQNETRTYAGVVSEVERLPAKRRALIVGLHDFATRR